MILVPFARARDAWDRCTRCAWRLSVRPAPEPCRRMGRLPACSRGPQDTWGRHTPARLHEKASGVRWAPTVLDLSVHLSGAAKAKSSSKQVCRALPGSKETERRYSSIVEA